MKPCNITPLQDLKAFNICWQPHRRLEGRSAGLTGVSFQVAWTSATSPVIQLPHSFIKRSSDRLLRSTLSPVVGVSQHKVRSHTVVHRCLYLATSACPDYQCPECLPMRTVCLPMLITAYCTQCLFLPISTHHSLLLLMLAHFCLVLPIAANLSPNCSHLFSTVYLCLTLPSIACTA